MLKTIASVLLFITATAYAVAPASEGQECGASGNLLGMEYCVYCSEGDPTATMISFSDDTTCKCAGDVPCAVLVDGKQGTWENYKELFNSN